MRESKNNFIRLQSLCNTLVKRNASIEDAYLSIINEGLKAFSLSLGIVSRIENEDYSVLSVSAGAQDISAGMVYELKNTYCKFVVDEQRIISVEHAGAHSGFNSHPVYINMKLESYIAAPVWVRGIIWGTLNFSSTKIREEIFSDDDIEFIKLMADGIGTLVERSLFSGEKEYVISTLSKSNDVLESIFENSTVGMALVSSTGQWIKVNSSLTNMLGYSERYLLSISACEITHSDYLFVDAKQLEELSLGRIKSYQLEKRYVAASGDYIWVLISVSLIRESNGSIKYYISQMQSVDERKKMEIELENQKNALYKANVDLEKMATEDSLTGIANRRKFMFWFDYEVLRARDNVKPLALVITDIDLFKSYNDAYGHHEGDLALINIANRLVSSLRTQDKIARFGGEEFIILMPDTTDAGCFLACERLRASIESLSVLKRKVTISIGAVIYHHQYGDSVRFDSLLELADKNLYEAKKMGRNRVLISNAENYAEL